MSAATILTTKRLEIVPLDPDRDAESLHAMFSDPDHGSYGWTHPSRTVPETRERLQSELAENGGWTWVIRLHPNTEALGTIGLYSDQGTSIRGLSWHLRRSHWGQGIMSEAARVVIDHLRKSPASKPGSTRETCARLVSHVTPGCTRRVEPLACMTTTWPSRW